MWNLFKYHQKYNHHHQREDNFSIQCWKKFVCFHLKNVWNTVFSFFNFWMFWHLWNIVVIRINEHLSVLNLVSMEKVEKPPVVTVLFFSVVYFVECHINSTYINGIVHLYKWCWAEWALGPLLSVPVSSKPSISLPTFVFFIYFSVISVMLENDTFFLLTKVGHFQWNASFIWSSCWQ